jgi:glycosyltransferase involved in cell wall biosynthesis
LNIKTVVVHLISSLGRGGRERQLSTIYKYSDKEHISTKIICFNKTSISYTEEYDMSQDIIFLSEKSLLKRYVEIRKAVKASNADIVWSWGGIEATYALLLSFTSRIKHINGSIRHGIVSFKSHHIWRFLILHLSKNIVANSQAGLYANKLKRGSVLYNGVDGKFFFRQEKESSEIRGEFSIPNEIPLLVSVANLIPYKDYDTILKALSIIKSRGIAFHYIAIGEGIERSRIESLVEELDLSENISMPGSRTDVKDILFSSDIFLHSSLGEGCSNAILEAMAAGLPIIATDTGGTSEIVDETMGVLFGFQNVEQLTKLIQELICNIPLRKKLAGNSKKKAEIEFSAESMINQYYGILKNV